MRLGGTLALTLSSLSYAQPVRRTRPTLSVVRETAPMYRGGRGQLPEKSECDALTALGEEIMTVSERLQVETHRLLLLIAEFDRRQGWKVFGFASSADWLAFSTRLDKVTAREKVRIARALAGLPETSAAMSRGEVSFSQVRAITRVADEENERELLGLARSTSAAGLERVVRSWRRFGREDEAAAEARRHAARCFSVFPDDQGGYQARGTLDPEVGVLLMRAIEAASDALYQGSVPEVTPEQRRADALALIVERAMAAGFWKAKDGCEDRCRELGEESAAGASDCAFGRPGGSGERAIAVTKIAQASDVSAETLARNKSPDLADSDASAETRVGNNSTDLADAHASAEARPKPSPVPHSPSSERYLVLLHVDESTLTAGGEPGRSNLEDGTRVSAETARRLACGAGVVRVVHRRNGREVQIEGKTRTIPTRLWRALQVRDRGCRFPGCGSRHTVPHHLRHWVDGGPTQIDNLILLCNTHHRLLHEGGFRLRPNPERPERPTFVTPRGIAIPDVTPRMKLDGRALEPAPVNGRTRTPEWETDVPLALYLRTMKALT